MVTVTNLFQLYTPYSNISELLNAFIATLGMIVARH